MKGSTLALMALALAGGTPTFFGRRSYDPDGHRRWQKTLTQDEQRKAAAEAKRQRRRERNRRNR